jgi:HEXXH motif-containing protein
VRWLINTTPLAPWNFGQPAGRNSSLGFTPLGGLLRPVPSELLLALREEGLHTVSIDGLPAQLEAVDRLLKRVPDLAEIVSRTLAVIHPLAARPGYDISHSQPRWRDKIFVSFPERLDEIGSLRLAESVVHEAMHLHLTIEEERNTFIARSTETLYSPWKDTIRSAQGVLHGLFVFCCIGAFLSCVAENGSLTGSASKYLTSRLAKIRDEISEIDFAALEAALTPYGIRQIRRWTRGMSLR